ncbi:uncharacterized protein [Polyergus mexicanus]|uniref:uncharacterized protein n=1 Tax=Polyergus mexicanus TaxID=615972 RepID=UPI0038B4E624
MTSDVEKMYRQPTARLSSWQYERYKKLRISKKQIPLGAATVLSDFYVDDLLTGANDLGRAIAIRDEVITALAKGGFKLRKWSLNSKKLFPDSVSSEPILTLDKMKKLTLSNTVTKRAILSSIAPIFDPLGLLEPVIITAKILIQKLWLLKIDWDETVPLEIETKWRAYENQLSLLNTLRIPKKIIAHSPPYTIEIHGFCDASMDVYGVMVYIRKISFDGHRETRLLCAKSRVAPTKSVTLARLELCAAHLLAQLIHRISQALGIEFDGIHHWSDSMIALAWIRTNTKRWSIFVSNRVGQIQELTDISSWKHETTSTVTPILEDLPEARKSTLMTTNTCQEWNVFYTISSMTRLIQIKNQSMARNSKLISLSPFIENGVIRVGSRLSHFKLPYFTKHPIVLLSKYEFTKMLIYWKKCGKTGYTKLHKVLSYSTDLKANSHGEPLHLKNIPHKTVHSLRN